ncbi:MAG TPA: response regulator transcription factor, partial [Nitrospira sp.]
MQTLHSLPESPVTHNLFDEGTRWRVVIVDAHTVMREMLRMTLNAYSDLIVVVGEAFDGEEAVEQATRYQPDLVLMDVNLPQDSSLEATRAIKRLLPDSVIVGMSAEY